MGLGEIGHVIAWRILPPHTIAAHSAALSNSRIYCAAHSFIKFTPKILLKISAFITYVPRFKDDIILVQADWPLNVAPPYLPQSIALLLSNLKHRKVPSRCYGHLRNKSFRKVAGQKRFDKKFKMHGKDLGYH